MRISDILLLPRALYQKVSGRKATLYIGMFLIGVLDIVFDITPKWQDIFGGNSLENLIIKILVTLIFVVIVGFVDVVFFAIPLFDLFKKFKKEEEISEPHNIQRIRLMKVYMLAHIVIVPVEIIIYAIVGDGSNLDYNFATYLAVLLALALPFWFAAAISRGIKSIYRFAPVFRGLVFIVVFIWTYALSYAFEFGIDWLMNLFYGL